MALRSLLCPAKETAPEGADAGTAPAAPPGQRKRIESMTRKSTPTNAKPATASSRTDRQAVTLEMVARLPPASGPDRQPRRHFGLEPVDYDGIRDVTQEHITRAAQAFGMALNREGLADPPATDHRFLRQLGLRSRAVLRHQEVGCDGADQQAAQRRPR